MNHETLTYAINLKFLGHKIVDNFVSTESGLGLEERQTQIVKFRDHTKSQHDVLAQNHGNEKSDDPSPIITGKSSFMLSFTHAL